VQALVALPVLALALRAWGFRRVYGVLLRSLPAASGTSQPPAAQEMASTVRLINAAAHHGLYRATCLPRSLWTWFLLRRLGVAGELRIGVRLRQGQLEAHAWVEHAGRVVNDRPDIGQQFRPLTRDGAAHPLHWV
jgi:hypothetical protein